MNDEPDDEEAAEREAELAALTVLLDEWASAEDAAAYDAL